MSNYQILEIVLDGLFFATVAAISVIFAIVRERSIRKAQTEQAPKPALAFPEVMNDAVACMPTPADLTQKPRMRSRVLNRLTGITPDHNRRVAEAAATLTRAEREFISSISDEGSRSTTEEGYQT